MCGAGSGGAYVQVHEWVSVCVRARAFHAVTELLFGSVLKVGFYIMKWNVVSKCVCVCWTFILP